MAWSWNWGVFAAALVVCTIVVMFSRGAMNAQNVAKYGEQADFRAQPIAALVGSIAAGAVYAAIATGIVGFLI